MKRALVEAPIIVTPGDERAYILDTDASGVSMGAVLCLVIDGQEHVVAYFSRVFTKCQRNYCVTRRGLLAVVTAMKVRPNISCSDFTVQVKVMQFNVY